MPHAHTTGKGLPHRIRSLAAKQCLHSTDPHTAPIGCRVRGRRGVWASGEFVQQGLLPSDRAASSDRGAHFGRAPDAVQQRPRAVVDPDWGRFAAGGLAASARERAPAIRLRVLRIMLVMFVSDLCSVICLYDPGAGLQGISDAARNPVKWRLADRTALASCDITKLSLRIVARPGRRRDRQLGLFEITRVITYLERRERQGRRLLRIGRGVARLGVQALLAESRVQLDAGDAQAPRRLGLVPPRLAQDLLDGAALHGVRVGCRRRGGGLRRVQREVRCGRSSALAENRGPFSALRSSRTFPGQPWASNASLASGGQTGGWTCRDRSGDVPRNAFGRGTRFRSSRHRLPWRPSPGPNIIGSTESWAARLNPASSARPFVSR